MVPNVAWLEGTAGLTLSDGVVTDDRCQTGIPGVFAGGDCARWFNQRAGRLTRVEHWRTAIEHGEALAASILGSTDPFTPLSFVWSLQHGARLQWVSDGAEWNRVEIDDTGSSGGFVARYSRGDVFCAGFAIDNPRAIAGMRRELLQTGAQVPTAVWSG
jgi:3-phenylpropionate/trans-cinnamate dioxygenase ferredoxin reductase subunit